LRDGSALGGRLVRTLTTQLRGTSAFDESDKSRFRLTFHKNQIRTLDPLL
jgi:two-component sensor histidine kinase